LISGFNEIDVDDWERNTDYEGYSKNDITIIHFWKVINNYESVLIYIYSKKKK